MSPESTVVAQLRRLDAGAAVDASAPTTCSTSAHARRVLDEDHYGLEEVKDRILDYIAVLALVGQARGPDPLPRRPARRRQDVARPLDRARAGTQVRPHVARRRARRSGDPRSSAHVHRRRCPAASSRRCGAPKSVNPVMLLDEIDKLGSDYRGDPARGAARGARPRAEPRVQRPLPRGRLRPLAGAVRHDGELARRRFPSRCATGWRSSGSPGYLDQEKLRDRAAVPDSATAARARDRAGGRRRGTPDVAPGDRARLHARGGRARARAPHSRASRASSRGARDRSATRRRRSTHGEGGASSRTLLGHGAVRSVRRWRSRTRSASRRARVHERRAARCSRSR